MHFTLLRDDGHETQPVPWTNTYVDYRTDAVMGNDVTFFGMAEGRYTHYCIYVRGRDGVLARQPFELPEPVLVDDRGSVTLDSLQLYFAPRP